MTINRTLISAVFLCVVTVGHAGTALAQTAIGSGDAIIWPDGT
jgi:hypothetical protein